MSQQMPLVFSRLAVAALAASLLAASVPARADAPQVRTQVPGYYRMPLGDFEITALHDGEIKLDTSLLRNATPQQMQLLVARMFRQNPTATAVNAFLVNTGGRLVLIDTGAAQLFGPSVGRILTNLRAAGYEPSQIDAVLLTHLHGDHVGGLLGPDGQPAFPKATVYAPQAEADHWLNPETAAKAPEQAKRFFKMPQDATAPYIKAGAFKTFQGTAELLPGIKPVPTPGHTPGHTAYLIESRGQRLLVWGDIVHNAAVQFERPQVTIEFDTDARQALQTRKDLFKWTAKDALLVAGAHLPFPGLGRVRPERRGHYSWVPVDFAPWPEASPQPTAPKP